MRWLLLVAILIGLAGCFGGGKQTNRNTTSGNDGSSAPVTGGGGFFGGDRPPRSVPDDLDHIADAVPQRLPLSKTGNKPYVALGKRYRPLKSARGYRKTGTASWYGKKFHGRRTSSGEPYDMFAMTAAHPVLPLPSFVRVTNLDNGRSVVVKVNDRGPFLHGRVIDLSYAAAHRLGITARGTGRVRVTSLEAESPEVGPASAVTQAEMQPIKDVYEGTAGGAEQSRGPFHLQIGVFSDLINALTLRQQLRQQGYRLWPPTDRSLAANGPPYRVMAGPFNDIRRAERMRQLLSKQTGQPVRLVDG